MPCKCEFWNNVDAHDGLTLSGGQVLTKAALSFLYWAGQGRENITNGSARYGEASSKSSQKPPP